VFARATLLITPDNNATAVLALLYTAVQPNIQSFACTDAASLKRGQNLTQFLSRLGPGFAISQERFFLLYQPRISSAAIFYTGTCSNSGLPTFLMRQSASCIRGLADILFLSSSSLTLIITEASFYSI
jgi:hypothetical protein